MKIIIKNSNITINEIKEIKQYFDKKFLTDLIIIITGDEIILYDEEK